MMQNSRFRLIRSGAMQFAGNNRLKIYGTLRCSSGKRMNEINRVFFSSEAEARAAGFRACGNCLGDAYRLWKTSQDPG